MEVASCTNEPQGVDLGELVVGDGAEGLVVHFHVILFSHGSQYGTLNLETQ